MRKSRMVKKCLTEVLLVIFFLFFWLGKAFAMDGNEWARTYGGTELDYAEFIQQTSDGGYIVVCRTDSFGAGSADVWVLKLDGEGSVVWQKTFGGPGYETATSIQQTSDMGYVLTSYMAAFGTPPDFDLWVLKLNADGTVAWQKTYDNGGSEGGVSIQETSGGGYVVIGVAGPPVADGGAVWILKLDTNGNVIWEKTYGGPDNDYARSIQQIVGGGYIVAGITGPHDTRDVWVLKLNVDGSVAWQKTYGGADRYEAVSIHQTSDGGYIVGGTCIASDADFWVMKLEGDGTVEWEKAYGGTDSDWADSLQKTSDGGYVIAGYTRSFGAGGADAWVLKLKGDGTVEWERTYGGTEDDWATSVQQTSDGGYILAGSTDLSDGGSSDAWVLKLDSSGNITDCPMIGTSAATVTNTVVTVTDTGVTGVDTHAVIQTGTAASADTTATEDTQCVYPPRPEITINPAQINFGSQLPGSFSDGIVKVTNQGIGDLIIGTITSPSMPFSKVEDHCSGQTIPTEGTCAVTIRFLPPYVANFSGSFDIPSNDSDESVVTVLLSGAGSLPINLAAPLNGSSFDVCSLYSLPTFAWNAGEVFMSYEIQFSSDMGFGSRIKVKTSATTNVIKSSTWKRVLSIPGGTVYWRVVGTRADRTKSNSEVWSMIIVSADSVGSPNISPTSKSSLPELSWKNHCNSKFKVWFGSDSSFTKKSVLSLSDADPTDNGWKYTKTLTSGQWMKIRKLVGDVSGSPIYWYVESWDKLKRHAQTSVTTFTLMD